MSKTDNSYLKRWLTGLILAPLLVIVILFCSETVFSTVVILFILGGVWEYNYMVFGNGFAKEKIEGLIFAIIIPLFVFLGNSQHLLAVLAFSVLLIFILFVLSIKESNFDVLSVAKVIFGIMYPWFLHRSNPELYRYAWSAAASRSRCGWRYLPVHPNPSGIYK